MRGRAAFYDQSIMSYRNFLRTSSAEFWIRRKHKYQILKSFPSKNNFTQSPRSTEKFSSKYNGYRSVIDIAQNFEHVQNKNFNLYTRQKEVDSAPFMNVNTKNSQIEHCLCPSYGMIYRPDIYNLQVR